MILRPCFRRLLFLLANPAKGADISLRSCLLRWRYFSSFSLRSMSRSINVMYPSNTVRSTMRPMKSCHSATDGGPALGTVFGSILSGRSTIAGASEIPDAGESEDDP